MDVEQLKHDVAKRLPLKRFEHVLRVTDIAKQLAHTFHVPVAKVQDAALLHDVAKFIDKQVLYSKLVQGNGDERLLSFHHELWHGPVGAMIAHEEFGIVDEEVLNAIRYHTTGRAGMSKVEKIIYIADMIEPGRDFPGIEDLRKISRVDIDEAMGACIHQTVQFLTSKKLPLFPDSIDCYNEHVMKRG